MKANTKVKKKIKINFVGIIVYLMLGISAYYLALSIALFMGIVSVDMESVAVAYFTLAIMFLQAISHWKDVMK